MLGNYVTIDKQNMYTVANLEALCTQVAIEYPAKTSGGYMPTAKQILFFVLVWLLKKKSLVDNELIDIEIESLNQHIKNVAFHLDQWGQVVTNLKLSNEKEWQLLFIQIQKATKIHAKFNYDLQDDATENTLLKIFRLLKTMFNGEIVEAQENIFELAVEQCKSSAVYDFRTSFYLYVNSIAHNEFIGLLRKDIYSSNRSVLLADAEEELTVSLSELKEKEEQHEAAQQQLKSAISRLFSLTEAELPSRSREVLYKTLASRRQFQLALEITGIESPKDIPQYDQALTDEEIAKLLGHTVNSVRVLRHRATGLISKLDSELGRLLTILLNPRF